MAKTSSRPARTPGIEERHSGTCPAAAGDTCECTPSFRAWVYDRRTGQKIRKSFPTLAAAKAWRIDALSALQRGQLAPATRLTLREAAQAWHAGATAEPPTVLTRSGRRYKPSVLRGYEADLRRYILPTLGSRRLSEVRRADLQELVDKLLGQGLSASKVRNVVMPVRVIFRHALERDQVMSSPTANLRLPTGLGRRERVASVSEAEELFAALLEDDRALWATAFYAGLRLGELRALRWDDVDLMGGVLRVERGWDAKEGEIEPKSRKGRRRVPIMGALREYLEQHQRLTGREGHDLVFGASAERAFTPSHMRKRATKAWDKANLARSEQELDLLRPIGLHELRHSFVSFACEAGLSLEEVGDYVGHSSTYMTDRYRHLFAGRERQATDLLDAYRVGRIAAAARTGSELAVTAD